MNIISKVDAKAKGEKYFFTAAACKRGHIALRFVSDGGCVECKRIQSLKWYSDKEKAAAKARKWRAENQEQNKATRKAWRKSNHDRQIEYERKYYAENKEDRLEASRRWYQRNIDQQRARAIAYRNTNIEEMREKSRAYNAANKPRIATISRNRRAKQRANGGTHTQADIESICKMQRGRCAICREKFGDKYHVDHIMPLALGGSNDRRNLQLLCIQCNKSKSARDPITFMQMRGMLL